MKRARMTLGALVFLSAALTLQADWTTKRLSNNTGYSINPDVAVWGENAYVVWADDTPSPGHPEIYFRKSTDGGATWPAVKRLTNNAGSSTFPSLAVLGPKIYVVWQDDTPDPVNGNSEIFFKKSTDGGATWLATRRLTNYEGGSAHPAVAVSGANVYVIWSDESPGNRDIHFRRSTDYGETWQDTARLTNSPNDTSRPDIAADGANVYAVWYDWYAPDPANYDVYFRKSEDFGVYWPAARRLTTNAGDSSVPEIAVDGENVFVAWFDFSTGDDAEIYFKNSANGGETWNFTRRLTNTPTESHAAAIAVRDAAVHIVWMEELSPDVEIFYRRSDDGGSTWNTAFNLSNNAGFSRTPNIAVNGSHLFVVWYDDVDGNEEIYVKFKPV